MSIYTRRVALALLRELGIPVPKGGRPRALSPAQEAEALEQLRRGDSRVRVAKHFGVGERTVYRLQKRARNG